MRCSKLAAECPQKTQKPEKNQNQNNQIQNAHGQNTQCPKSSNTKKCKIETTIPILIRGVFVWHTKLLEYCLIICFIS